MITQPYVAAGSKTPSLLHEIHLCWPGWPVGKGDEDALRICFPVADMPRNVSDYTERDRATGAGKRGATW
jgi:hypothetical protein